MCGKFVIDFTHLARRRPWGAKKKQVDVVKINDDDFQLAGHVCQVILKLISNSN